MHSRLFDRLGSSVVLVLLTSATSARAQAPPPKPDHSQEAVVIEQARSVFRFENDGTGSREMYVRLRTQSDAGVQQWGQLLFGYNAANERPEIAFVRVRKSDGSTVVTPADSVQDLSSPVQRVAPIYTDFRQKHVTVQGLRPGDTLEFNVITTVHTALAPGQFWTEFEFNRDAIVLDELLEIDVPGGKAVTLKTQPGFDPEVKENGGRRTYRWTRSNLTREKDEDDDKKKADAAEEPRVAPVRLTTFQSWEQVGRWYAAIEATQRAPGAEIRKKAAELTAGRTSDLDKLEALYAFVATNFRYVSLSLGLGRYQPRAAADVLREQYGDCKDKHTLLASLIDAAGLRASAALINSSTKIDPTFPSPSQFDHVITKAGTSGEAVWLDTTAEVAPFRLLPPPLRKKQALVIDVDGTPRLEETPANPPMKSFLLQEVDATLGEAGELRAHLKVTMRGDLELLMRTVFRNTPAADWKAVFEGGFGRAGNRSGEVSNWKVTDPAALKDPFQIELDVSFDSFVSWNGGKAALPLPFAESVSAPNEYTSEDGPVTLGPAPNEIAYKLRLRFPAHVTVRAPLPISMARDYAEYRTSYSTAGSTFSAERIFLVRQSELPSDRKEDHVALLRVIAADTRQQVALQTTSATAANVSRDLKASELNRNGYAALQAGNYAEAVALLKRVVELEPKDKTAWNNLGRAYMGLRQTEPAIEAYRKQIEVNPYDAQAHNNLGHAYFVLQKYGDAEAAFKKQIELNPLDDYAATTLGSIYLELGRYDQALAQLQRAVTLKPEEAWLQLQLGKAHLNLKQEPEAIAAFDRAVELAPTPTTWNDIAYELSLRGVHLDRALQYAESAVASATAASRTLDIARGDEKSLAVVKSLGAYWDTLGWVHFARGDFSRAEPFVEAAWRLGQHAEVGDHLAQIYEKTGRRDEAVKTYAMALAARRPSDDIRDRLASLLGTPAKLDMTVSLHRGELAKARTFTIAAAGPRGKTADFLILFSSSGQVDGVRFVSGDEALKPFASDIQKVSYRRLFPDTTPAKLLRRGILACPPKEGSCTFTLLLPDDTEAVK